jgi:hypothetical protein
VCKETFRRKGHEKNIRTTEQVKYEKHNYLKVNKQIFMRVILYRTGELLL